MRFQPPPQTEAELLARARALAGLPLGAVAARLGVPVPPDLRRHKGWVGELMEAWLGADAGVQAEPDFTTLGIELKTLPVDRRGLPCESTYVCTVPLEAAVGQHWETSWVRRKLARVLWVPVQGERGLPLAERRIGTPLLWSPDAHQESRLRHDWEELMEMVCMGEIAHISARLGEVLQIRPKAPHARARRGAIGADGERVSTNPRGFYLRTTFTADILRRHYALDVG